MVREIPLTQGKIALVDDEDFERVMQHKWCAVKYTRKDGTVNWYAKRGIYRKGGNAGSVLLHRFVLNAPKGVQVDHQNGDGLNCTRANLRRASHAENQRNRRSHNRHGYKGVWEVAGRWTATIADGNGGNHHLGTFASKDLAAAIYDEAARHFYGEFARTNFRTRNPLAVARFRKWLSSEVISDNRPPRKLTDNDVRSIRARYAAGSATVAEMAAEYGVTKGAIYHALEGRTFAHITDVPPLAYDKRSAA